MPTKVLDPPARPIWKRRTVVAVVATLLLAAVVALPYVLSQDRGNAGQQSPTSSPVTPLRPTPTPSPSAWPTTTGRYATIPDICTKLVSRASKIVPSTVGGTEDTPYGDFAGLAEAHECDWSTEGEWQYHPWAARFTVEMFRFWSGSDASAAFEAERTDVYDSALRLHDYADALCMRIQADEETPYTNVMFRVDNLLVQVSYNMKTKGSPDPAVAKPRGLDMAKYIYELVTPPRSTALVGRKHSLG
ncbi:hypothetical protein [Streptomyces sp. GESEQ-35]|uniref:hypothetical protein n=1 Tax=Streptomyces sp. GESEQ-35 TaxID=2812657 RepID=UPI001B32461F|nr:hypothetical protein [Streptomyces sp. GESEQ-35]